MKTLTIVTFEGMAIHINLDHRANNCYSVTFPDRFQHTIERSLKYNDNMEILSDGVVWYTGSLIRIFEFVAEYVGQSEV